MKRKTVNLSDRDLDRLAPFFEGGSAEQLALARAVGEEAPQYSDSAALRSLALAGAAAIREKLLDDGYRALAQMQTEEDEHFYKDVLEMAAEFWDVDE